MEWLQNTLSRFHLLTKRFDIGSGTFSWLGTEKTVRFLHLHFCCDCIFSFRFRHKFETLAITFWGGIFNSFWSGEIFYVFSWIFILCALVVTATFWDCRLNGNIYHRGKSQIRHALQVDFISIENWTLFTWDFSKVF